MKKSRYKVVTVTGWPIQGNFVSGGMPAGVTASVLDTEIIHREVARFRSEDQGFSRPGGWRGREGAVRDAQNYADRLNAGCEPAFAS